MKLLVLDEEFAVSRLDATEATPSWAAKGSLSSVTRTTDELSVVCAAAAVPVGVRAERGWRCLRVAGRLDLSLTGVLASIANPLAAAGLSIFAISTHDTDFVLVRKQSLREAIGSLTAAGHEVVAAASLPAIVPGATR